MNDLISVLVDAAEYVDDFGYQSAVKLRDRREPGYRAKTEAELRLLRIMARIFRRQKEKLRAWLESRIIKADKPPLPDDDYYLPDDADTADLVRELTKALQGGITLFGQAVGIPIDYTMSNTEASRYAQRYAYDLIRNVNQTTRDTVRNAITQYVEVPGFTIGDAMALMPFGEERAMRVAVTEITRAYAEGQRMAGEELEKEFPDLEITKTWYTNNDDLVCPLCGPLNGTTVSFREPFDIDEDGNEVDMPPRHVSCRCSATVTTKI
jgi:hypothetical protein